MKGTQEIKNVSKKPGGTIVLDLLYVYDIILTPEEAKTLAEKLITPSK